VSRRTLGRDERTLHERVPVGELVDVLLRRGDRDVRRWALTVAHDRDVLSPHDSAASTPPPGIAGTSPFPAHRGTGSPQPSTVLPRRGSPGDLEVFVAHRGHGSARARAAAVTGVSTHASRGDAVALVAPQWTLRLQQGVGAKCSSRRRVRNCLARRGRPASASTASRYLAPGLSPHRGSWPGQRSARPWTGRRPPDAMRRPRPSPLATDGNCGGRGRGVPRSGGRRRRTRTRTRWCRLRRCRDRWRPCEHAEHRGQ